MVRRKRNREVNEEGSIRKGTRKGKGKEKKGIDRAIKNKKGKEVRE